jgi:hypothetical protein
MLSRVRLPGNSAARSLRRAGQASSASGLGGRYTSACLFPVWISASNGACRRQFVLGFQIEIRGLVAFVQLF